MLRLWLRQSWRQAYAVHRGVSSDTAGRAGGKESRNIRAVTRNSNWQTSEAAKNPDVFGTLGDKTMDMTHSKIQQMDLDYDEDENPHIRLSEKNRVHSPIWYGRQIEKLAKRGMITDAIHLFEVQMLKEDRVMPSPYVFTVLIGVLGRVGYSHKAFKVFNLMKKMDVEPEDPTYTALFNACANSPWQEDGLRRAKQLHGQLQKIDINVITYNSIIKAYGKCGELVLAFAVVDEMVQKQLRPDSETYACLLMACISDRHAGLKHTIEIWRRMRKRKVQFTLYHYNLLLRAVRDCGVGDAHFAQQLFKNMSADSMVVSLAAESDGSVPSTALPSGAESTVPAEINSAATSGANKDVSAGARSAVPSITDSVVPASEVASYKTWWQLPTEHLQPLGKAVSVLDSDTPNVLNPRGKLRHVAIDLAKLNTGHQRLALLGGMAGVLRHMQADHVVPNIKSFTLLLEMLPDEQWAEEDLIHALLNHKVQLDIDLLNLVIRRRNLRRDHNGVKQIVEMISKLRLEPTIYTFGCLAMGCWRESDARKLLDDMQAIGIIPTAEIFNILSYQARLNFSYRRMLLTTITELEVKPEKNFILRMEKAIVKAKALIVKGEREESVHNYNMYKSGEFKKQFKFFMLQYKPWLLSTGMELDKHPWQQFNEQQRT